MCVSPINTGHDTGVTAVGGLFFPGGGTRAMPGVKSKGQTHARHQTIFASATLVDTPGIHKSKQKETASASDRAGRT